YLPQIPPQTQRACFAFTKQALRLSCPSFGAQDLQALLRASGFWKVSIQSRFNKHAGRAVRANAPHKCVASLITAARRNVFQQLAGNTPQTGLIDGMIGYHGFSLIVIKEAP